MNILTEHCHGCFQLNENWDGITQLTTPWGANNPSYASQNDVPPSTQPGSSNSMIIPSPTQPEPSSRGMYTAVSQTQPKKYPSELAPDSYTADRAFARLASTQAARLALERRAPSRGVARSRSPATRTNARQKSEHTPSPLLAREDSLLASILVYVYYVDWFVGEADGLWVLTDSKQVRM